MAGDPLSAGHAKLTAMAMLFSHAEATERMVALPATADGGQKIDPEAARRACRLWLEAHALPPPVQSCERGACTSVQTSLSLPTSVAQL